MKISRRQFLKYLMASGAAMGFSQSDLMKLKEALATPQSSCACGNIGNTQVPAPHAIYLVGQGCSGCVQSLTNYIADSDDPIPTLKLVPTAGVFWDTWRLGGYQFFQVNCYHAQNTNAGWWFRGMSI